MNARFILGLLAAGCLGGQSLPAAAAPQANPYQPIVERNVFGLVPIPVPPPPVDPATLIPPPKITPNGIMTVFGKLQVLFKVAVPAKPGQPPKDESYVMSEGDRQDDIEVQKIDEPAATITFNNHGVVQELPLLAATSSGGGAPSAPAGGAASRPGIPVPRMEPANGGAAPNGFGGRFGRNRNVATGGNPDAGGSPGFGTAASAAQAAPEPVMPVEQQVIMIEAQRMKALQEGDPIAKILPPTEMTPEVTGNPPDATPAPGD